MSFFGNRRQVEQPAPQPAVEKVQLPKPAAPQAPVGFETVLGANSSMEGVFQSNANVRLDGAFTGTLEITGNVLVGETAKINADINAKNISIAGAVRGNVSGKKVQLLRTGRIWGDIRATALTTEEGAFIDGKITMVSHEALAPSSAETQPLDEPEPIQLVIPAEEPEIEVELAREFPDVLPSETLPDEPKDESHTDAETTPPEEETRPE
jgi:cytoskeletal protein CcmA (bactofilin family)